MGAVNVVDHQFTAVVFFRCAEKKSGGDIGADPVRRPWHLAYRIVQMRAEGFTSFVAVEKRRKDPERQRRRDKKRVPLQGCDDHVAQFPRLWASLCEVPVVLNDTRLVASGDPPVYPGGAIHHVPAMSELLLVEDRWNVDDHRFYLLLELEHSAGDERH